MLVSYPYIQPEQASIHFLSTITYKYLDEEAGEEEKRAENNDAEGACEHGVLKGFHNLERVGGDGRMGEGWMLC